MLLTLRILHGEPRASLNGAACIVAEHPNLASAVADAYAWRSTHETFIVKGDVVVLDRTVRGAAQFFDALIQKWGVPDMGALSVANAAGEK